jgi:hypothetical protein
MRWRPGGTRTDGKPGATWRTGASTPSTQTRQDGNAEARITTSTGASASIVAS